MNSKIEIVFNNIPDEGTELIIVDSAYGATTIKAVFVQVPTQFNHTNRSTSAFNCATYYYFFLTNKFPNSQYTYTINNGVATVIIESKNPSSSFSVTSNTTAGKVTTSIDNNSGTGVPTTLDVSDRTPINSASRITFVNSPVHIRLQNAATDNTIQSAYVYLWVWNGAQNKTLNSPNITLFKNKVSGTDKYINFQIADYIKAFIENPLDAPNTNQPNYVYNEATPPAVTGQGVFWQIVADITSAGVTTRTHYGTNFATLGYRWNYEQSATGNNGLSDGGSTGFIQSSDKWYNSKIANYITQSFDLTKSVAEATAGNLIVTTPVTPPASWKRCSRDSALIVYINKLGLWAQFTPHGKITVETDADYDEQNKAYRDPMSVDNTYVHSKLRSSLDVSQKYTINTGSLTESMINQVEQIIYSPKVYLILFNGDVQTETTDGITIDNTFVTIDNTNITIDSATVTEELLGYFKSFRQVPVIPMDKSFTRKTRVNDKNDINYNLKFSETNNKILDIR